MNIIAKNRNQEKVLGLGGDIGISPRVTISTFFLEIRTWRFGPLIVIVELIRPKTNRVVLLFQESSWN